MDPRQHNVHYFQQGIPVQPATGHHLKEYNAMVERLNRQNEQLNRNVADLIKENTRLKTQMNYRCIAGQEIRNRSQQHQRDLSSREKNVAPVVQTMQRVEFPFSKNIQMTSIKTTTPHSPPKITFGASNKTQHSSKVNSFYSPSPTFIDELSEEKFQIQQQNISRSRDHSLRKDNKQPEILKMPKQCPHHQNNTTFSEIQAEGTAEVKNNQELHPRLAEYHRQPVNPKILLEQLQEGIREVRSRFNLKDKERSLSPLYRKDTNHKRYDNIEEQKPRFKVDSGRYKKSNAPYVLNYSYNEVCPPRQALRRTNLDFIERKPKYAYAPFTTRDVLSRHYY